MKSTDELINDLKKQDQTSFLENETDYVQSGGAYLSKLLKEHHLQPGNLIRDLELERSYAYQILRGTRKPTRILLLRIGFYLQLSLSEFQRMLCNFFAVPIQIERNIPRLPVRDHIKLAALILWILL